MDTSDNSSRVIPALLLFAKILLFAGIQALFALGFTLAGNAGGWRESTAWWPIGVTAANLLILGMLVLYMRQSGSRYLGLFKFHREHVWRDLLTLLITFVVMGPLGVLPNILLQTWLYGNTQSVMEFFIQPLPRWAAFTALIAFPITQGITELPLYFGVVMPRLGRRSFPNLWPVVLPALMLGFQHLAAPLVFDLRFVAWRGLMFVPFALGAGVLLHWRPRLLPYMAIVHVLMNVSVSVMFLGVMR